MNTADEVPFRSMNIVRTPIDVRPNQGNIESKPFNPIPGGIPLVVSSGKRDVRTTEPTTKGTQNACSSPLSSPWKITDLPTAPMGVPLETTAIQLEGIPLPDISSRICAFMKLNSICCAYRVNKARVDCITRCGLKFVVQLWCKCDQEWCLDSVATGTDARCSMPTAKVEAAKSIILEVQRRRGCCIVMRYIRKLLYSAVLKNSVANVRNAMYDCYKQYKDSMRRLASASPRVRTVPEETRPRCVALLTSQTHDCHRLGMETLLVLVNPERVGSEQAEDIAQSLAFGTGKSGTSLRSTFLSICSSFPSQTRDIDQAADMENFSLSDQGSADRQQLRLLCLEVLSSCLDIIMKKERDYLCNEATMLDLGSEFWTRTMSFLLIQLDDYAQRQHEAALAVKCLRILESLQPGLLIPLTDSFIVSKTIKAFKFGQQHHLFLEQESENLLRSLHLMIS